MIQTRLQQDSPPMLTSSRKTYWIRVGVSRTWESSWNMISNRINYWLMTKTLHFLLYSWNYVLTDLDWDIGKGTRGELRGYSTAPNIFITGAVPLFNYWILTLPYSANTCNIYINFMYLSPKHMYTKEYICLTGTEWLLILLL